MLRFNFHYSPFNKFGEYNFQYREDIKKDTLLYKFHYAINKNQLQHKFLYDVFQDIIIEEDIVMESFDFMATEDELFFSSDYRSSCSEHTEKFLHSSNSKEREITYPINDGILKSVAPVKKQHMGIEYKINILDFCNYKSKRLFGMAIDDKVNIVEDMRIWHDFLVDKQKTTFALNKIIELSHKKDDVGFNIKNNKELINELELKLNKIDDKNVIIHKSIIDLKAINLNLQTEEALLVENKSGKRDMNKQIALYFSNGVKDLIIEGIEGYGNYIKSTKDVNLTELISVEQKKKEENINIDKNNDENPIIKDIKEVRSDNFAHLLDKIIIKELKIKKDLLMDKVGARDVNIEKVINKLTKGKKLISIEKDTKIEKSDKALKTTDSTSLEKDSKDNKVEEVVELNPPDDREIKKEDEEKGLSLHKRLWFLQHHGKIDYKVLPNTDFDYPVNLNILENPTFSGVYKYFYTAYFTEVNSVYEIVAYDSDFDLIGTHKFLLDGSYDTKVDNIKIDAQVISYALDKHQVNFNIEIFHEDVSYFVIRQPKDIYGNFFSFTIAEEILNKSHPIPIGEDLGLKEIPIAINIMVDFVNMLILMWCKFYPRFVGYQGVQAIDGMVKTVHEWVTLETSLENSAIEDYHRCYRWFRWECEKVRNKAKYDPDLSGNLWVEEVIYELIDYMEMHHFNIIPEWYNISDMDEHRNNIFTEVDFDIPIVLDKVKGIRKRVIKNRKIYNKD